MNVWVDWTLRLGLVFKRVRDIEKGGKWRGADDDTGMQIRGAFDSLHK
jgi:hypothetical protein